MKRLSTKKSRGKIMADPIYRALITAIGTVGILYFIHFYELKIYFKVSPFQIDIISFISTIFILIFSSYLLNKFWKFNTLKLYNFERSP